VTSGGASPAREGAEMLERMHVALKPLCGDFTARRDGSVLPLFAILLVPLVALIGAAVDYSRANNVRTGLQGALDSALHADRQ
jgi:Flp pilus assembly protein TadG